MGGGRGKIYGLGALAKNLNLGQGYPKKNKEKRGGVGRTKLGGNRRVETRG